MHDMLPHAGAAVAKGTANRFEPGVADVHLNDASGLYKSSRDDASAHQQDDELRIDVDGRFPQMIASGTIRHGIDGRLHWLASLTAIGSNRWAGGILCKDGAAALLPHTDVRISIRRTPFGIGQTASVTFSGGGIADGTRDYRYASRYFHSIEFEIDTVEAARAATFDSLPIEKAFRRAGFNVSKSGGDGVLPIAIGSADASWTDMELHDAMQAYWSRFAGRSPRAMWLLFASRHAFDAWLGGLVFEDIGPDRRTGAALFDDSLVAEPPPGEAEPLTLGQVRTACREMARALAPRPMAWRDVLPPSLGGDAHVRRLPPALAPSPDLLGSAEFRFTDRELQIMRHAPDRSHRADPADCFDHHGFEQGTSMDTAFQLQVRVNRARPVFEFLEPVVLELRFTNVSGQPVPVDEACLTGADDLTVIIRKHGQRARRWAPYARACRRPSPRALAPGESIARSLFAGAGRNGWDLAEPGMYDVQAVLRRDDGDIVSETLRLRIAAPRDFEEDRLARDFFSDDVGRILAFDGSRFLESGNDTLGEIVERLPGRRVAVHARIALAMPLARSCKQLALGGGERHMTAAADAGGRIEVRAADPDVARKGLAAALLKDPCLAAETLGHVEYRSSIERFARWLDEQNDPRAAAACRDCLDGTLTRAGRAPQASIRAAAAASKTP